MELFSLQGVDPARIITGHYSIPLVLLSYIIATAASWVSLFLAGRVWKGTSQRFHEYLLPAAAVSLGSGIWSMHFVGMIALHLPVPMGYDFTITAVSLLIAIAATAAGFSLTGRGGVPSTPRLLASGGVMGLAICAMHYTGMAAMQIPGYLRYQPGLFFLSILISVTAATSALWISLNLPRLARMLPNATTGAAAAVMGLAVTGMHFTGMAAAVFIGDPASPLPSEHVNHDVLAFVVTVLIILILFIALFMAFYMEILHRRRVEGERAGMVAAMEQAETPILIADPSEIITYANKELSEVSEYPLEELLGQSVKMLRSDRHTPEFHREIRAVLGSKRTWMGNVVYRKKYGAHFELAMAISPILGETGEVAGYVMIGRDVTREAALKMAQERFTAVIHHELNTPLTTMRLLAGILREISQRHSGDEAMTNSVNILESSLASLELIAEEATMLVNLSMPKTEKSFMPIYINHLLSQHVQSAGQRARDAGRMLSLHFIPPNGHMELLVDGNQPMLDKAIAGILSNAVKYTPDGANITISSLTNGDTLVIEVRDEGMGIAPEYFKKLSEPYYSAHDPMQHSTGRYNYKGGGLGIGLAIARLVVEHHGGELRIQSEGKGKGTIVQITLPIPLLA